MEDTPGRHVLWSGPQVQLSSLADRRFVKTFRQAAVYSDVFYETRVVVFPVHFVAVVVVMLLIAAFLL